MSRKKKRVTIRDVAEKAGVSPTAVSFAFNSPEQLSEETCERILDVAAEMHYQPHPVARTLATGRTNTIGLVLPTNVSWALNDPFFRIFIGELGNLCDQHHLHILLLPVWSNSTISSLNSIAADGFVIVGINRDHAMTSAIEQSIRPVVLVDGDPSIAAPKVILADHDGANLAAKHLIDRGHRRLAVSSMRHSANKMKAIPFERRVEGFRRAVSDAGLPSNALQVVYTEEGLSGPGTKPFEDIWALPERPSAVLCVSDMRALNIMGTAREAGVSIPDDLVVVGFDNIPEASISNPPLTTIDQDIKGRCERAFDLLLDLINEPRDGNAAELELIDPVRLIVRESG